MPPLPNPLHPLVAYPEEYTLTPTKFQQAFNDGGAAVWTFESRAFSTVKGWFSKKVAPAKPATEAQSTDGPKAATAAGVTAGGQATDKHGNKLGPRGKPQVNKTKSNSRKAAQDKAQSEGSGTVEHSNPVVGQPHFHPTGADGEKKPTSTHHEYPK